MAVKRSRAAVAYISPPVINWQQIISDLHRHGCSQYRIAQHLGVGHSTARAWLHPKSDIGYGFGRALIRLHARYCGAAMTFQRLTEAEDCAYISPA